jgi:hypothetical protein
MATERGEMFEMVIHGVCKCRRTGCSRFLRPFTVSEQRVLEAAKRYDVRRSMCRTHIRPLVTNHVRGLLDDRETLENLREALGVENVYDLMLMNLLYEPARTRLLRRMVHSIAEAIR